MSTPYQKGYNFELQVKEYYEGLGFTVFRSAGSHTPADLIAIKGDCFSIMMILHNERKTEPIRLLLFPEVHLVQCKTDGKISKEEQGELCNMAEQLCCKAILASKPKRGVIEVVELNEDRSE